MTHPDIRLTTAQDIKALQQVAEAAGLFPGALLPEMIAPFLAQDQSSFWLTATVKGAPMAFAYTQAEPVADGVWNMRALAVHPSAQRQGQGRALVKAAEAELRRRQARLIIVDTSSTHGFAPARALYQSLDFDAEARIRDFWEAGDHKITFRKTL